MDEGFLLECNEISKEKGWKVIEGVAKFWEWKVYWNEDLKQFSVDNVMPPDEYAGIVDNSVFTNALISKNLQFASKVIFFLIFFIENRLENY